jgi:hypothetical protein
MTLWLAGIPVRAELILEPARMVDDDALATRLKRTDDRLALGDVERHHLDLTAVALLDDPPDGLAEFRAVLLAEHVGRKRDGLA